MTKFSPLPRSAAPAADLSGATVLIVDDSRACRMVQSAMARALGATPETAETAVQAMAKSAVTRFDLLILDIGLADADGRVLIKTLRDTPNGSAAAILCVSGLGGPDRKDGAIAAGADLFAEKPFASLDAFRATTGAAIARRKGRPAPDDITQSDGPVEGENLSPHVRRCALDDLTRAHDRMIRAVALGDASAARRAAHFISGVAGLIADTKLFAASRALEVAQADTGVLRNIETVLEMTHHAKTNLTATLS